MTRLLRDHTGTLSTFEPGRVVVHRRTRLPHWDATHGIQFLTFRTAAGRMLSHSDAEVIAAALLHDDDKEYRLLAWCVMPDHVHVILQPQVTIAMIVKTWKSVTARRIAGGPLWQHDYFDRLVRNARELHDTIEYVMNNPEAALLEGWTHKAIYPDRL